VKLINLDKQHKKNSLLIIGGTGFLGKSILDFLINFNPLKINKIIIISRGLHKIKIYKNLKKKFKIKIITADILRVKKLPSANYIIYAAKLKNTGQGLEIFRHVYVRMYVCMHVCL
jgi:FlaA1/EpsC-like NDP-sugar epimerase